MNDICGYDPTLDIEHPHPGPFPRSYRGHLPDEPVVWTLDEMARFNRALAEAFGWRNTAWS